MPEEIDVRALADHTYDGKPRVAGETYAIDPQYLETMIALRWVCRLEDAEPEARTVPAPAKPVPSLDEDEPRQTKKKKP